MKLVRISMVALGSSLLAGSALFIGCSDDKTTGTAADWTATPAPTRAPEWTAINRTRADKTPGMQDTGTDGTTIKDAGPEGGYVVTCQS
jgi:hypothetical protein